MWDAATHKQVWKVDRDREDVFKLSWSEDGKTVVAVCYSEGAVALVLFDGATGKEQKRVRGLPIVAEHVLSPDGKTVAGLFDGCSPTVPNRHHGSRVSAPPRAPSA